MDLGKLELILPDYKTYKILNKSIFYQKTIDNVNIYKREFAKCNS